MEKLKNISIGNTYNHVSNPILTKNEKNIITVSYENSIINEEITAINNVYYNTSIKSYNYNQESKLLEDEQKNNIDNITTSINGITIDNINSMKRSRSIAYNENSKVYCFAHYENFKKPYKIGKVIINTSNKLQKLTSSKFKILELNGEYLNNIRGKPILKSFKNGFFMYFSNT